MKKVTIYTGDPCSFCEAAKALLKTKNVEIEELDIWKDPAKAKDILGRTATLEVRLVDEAATEKLLNNNSPAIPRPNFFYDTDKVPYILKSDVLLTGENISDAQPGFDSQTSEPAVHLRLDSRGSSIFQKTTVS